MQGLSHQEAPETNSSDLEVVLLAIFSRKSEKTAKPVDLPRSDRHSPENISTTSCCQEIHYVSALENSRLSILLVRLS